MQQLETLAERAGAGLSGAGKSAAASTGLADTGFDAAATYEGMDRRREGVEEALATLSTGSESLRGIAHDARNMVTALGLYCELLEEPGVLSAQFAHYGGELRLVATASRRLVEKLVALESPRQNESLLSVPAAQARPAAKPVASAKREAAHSREQARRWDMVPAQPISNFSTDLLANRNLLAALAGPSVTVTVEAIGGKQPVHLTCEDLTRILVNLVKNAAEAMPAGGSIHIGLRETVSGNGGLLTLTVEDDGPGISASALDRIFESGYTTREAQASREGLWPATHRGLGLSITRSILESAGGKIHATNRSQGGARFEIELPVRAS